MKLLLRDLRGLMASMPDRTFGYIDRPLCVTEWRAFGRTLLALVQTICKRTTRNSAAQGGARRHEARTGRHETVADGTDGMRPPVS